MRRPAWRCTCPLLERDNCCLTPALLLCPSINFPRFTDEKRSVQKSTSLSITSSSISAQSISPSLFPECTSLCPSIPDVTHALRRETVTLRSTTLNCNSWSESANPHMWSSMSRSMYATGLICRCFDRLLLLRESTLRLPFSDAGLEDL